VPRRGSNISPKDFEPRRKNAVSLGSDSNIDNDFKAFKIGDIPTGLEFKKGSIRSTVDEFITHKETTQQLNVTSLRGNKVGGQTEPQFIFQAPDETNPSTGLRFNVFGETGALIRCAGTTGHLHLEADGNQTYYIGDHADNSFMWRFGDAVVGTPLMSLEHEGELKLYSTADSDDYATFTVADTGDLTIATVGDGSVDSDLTLDVDGDIELNADGGQVTIKDGTDSHFAFDCDNTRMIIYDDTTSNDYFSIHVDTEGATTLITNDNDGTSANLNFSVDGSVNFDVAGAMFEFDGCAVGFDLETPTYNSSDTDVDFQTGNKQFVTFGSGNITDLNLIFPKTSGNFVLLLKQDGSGSRTVTNWKAWDRTTSAAAAGSATVKFAGGSNPTLTTDANHVDIVSIFYDSDNEIAYGVASLDFQF